MEQERFMVIDNQKGVVIPLQSEKTVPLDKICNTEAEAVEDTALEEKVDKVYALMKAFIRQSIHDTIQEYNLQLTQELKEYEQDEMKRWERLEEEEEKRWEKLLEEDCKRWNNLENSMEKHFRTLDKNIRKKQDEGKKKGSVIFKLFG